MQRDMTRELEAAMQRRLPSYKAINVVILLLELGLSGIMIGGGIGLVQMQPWGRMLTIVYTFFSPERPPPLRHCR
jgi:hypothetical protein